MTAPPGRIRGLSPYLMVADARRALDWYVEAFGASTRGDPIVMPDDRIGHAELDVGPARVMLADEFPELGLLAPSSRGGTTVSLHLTVDDADRVVDRAVAAGAELERSVAAGPDGPPTRLGVVRDPFGHRWIVES